MIPQNSSHSRKTLGIVVLSSLGALILITLMPSRSALGGSPSCARTKFDTELVKKACEGGQSKAKKAMKAWVKDAKKRKAGLECSSCHEKMAPKYPLKPDGLKLFQELGGK